MFFLFANYSHVSIIRFGILGTRSQEPHKKKGAERNRIQRLHGNKFPMSFR